MLRHLGLLISQRSGTQIVPLASTNLTTKRMSSAHHYVQVSQCDGVREIALNEPKTRNSLSTGMMESILEALIKDWDDKELRCIVLSSTGPVWSAGHDLRELLPEKGFEFRKAIFQKLIDIIVNIRRAPVPVIAKVNGVVAAGGVQLVCSCDMVVCTDKSTFVTPSANFGVFASTPAIAMSRIMPRSKCLDMLITGSPITAEEALISGLVSRVVPESELEDEMAQIIGAIKKKSRSVIAFGKDFYYKQLHMNLEEAYKEGVEKMMENLTLPDSQEGVRSFVEKRPPNWSHL